jgi:hypothetical protein
MHILLLVGYPVVAMDACSFEGLITACVCSGEVQAEEDVDVRPKDLIGAVTHLEHVSFCSAKEHRARLQHHQGLTALQPMYCDSKL